MLASMLCVIAAVVALAVFGLALVLFVFAAFVVSSRSRE